MLCSVGLGSSGRCWQREHLQRAGGSFIRHQIGWETGGLQGLSQIGPSDKSRNFEPMARSLHSGVLFPRAEPAATSSQHA